VIFLFHFRLLLLGKGTGHVILGLEIRLRRNALSGAVDHGAILYESLDHPVALARAMHTSIDTGRAEIVVALVTYVAMIMLVRHRVIAVVAVHNPGARIRWSWKRRRGVLHAESQIGSPWGVSEISEEVWQRY
jgi:hypothetical protein